MGRVLCIDFGRKRCGIAVTDPDRMIASGLDTTPTHLIEKFLSDYLSAEKVDLIVLGDPRQMNNEPSESKKGVLALIKRIKKLFSIEVTLHDERFTSLMAKRTILEGGVPKQKRKEKGLVDKVSAVIILQSFLESKSYKDNYTTK